MSCLISALFLGNAHICFQWENGLKKFWSAAMYRQDDSSGQEHEDGITLLSGPCMCGVLGVGVGEGLLPLRKTGREKFPSCL